MISGASDEELEIANARADVLLKCGSEVLEILDKTNEEYEKKLKSAINELNWDVDKLSRGLTKKEREIDRLNNIINELEKWCNETMKKYKLPLVEQNKGALGFTLPIQDAYQQVLDKLKALKEE